MSKQSDNAYKMGKANTRHGMARRTGKTSEYNAWRGLKKRCGLVTDPSFPIYGARGITVCDRWLHSFDNFYADMGAKPAGTSLHRQNNDLGYCKENCVWLDHVEHLRMHRNNQKCLRCFTDEEISQEFERRIIPSNLNKEIDAFVPKWNNMGLSM